MQPPLPAARQVDTAQLVSKEMRHYLCRDG